MPIFRRRKDRRIFEVPMEEGSPVESTLYDLLKQEIDRIVTMFEDAKADSHVTLEEIWTLTTEVISSLVKVAEEWGGAGTDKKQAVLDGISLFYDEVIAPIDIKWVPNLVEPAVDRVVKSLFMQVVDGVIDGVVGLLNKEQVFEKSE